MSGIKFEDGQKSFPKQSSIAQFVRSGQIAFGSRDTNLLENHGQAADEVQRWVLEQVRERLATAIQLSHDDLITLRPLLKLEHSSNVTGLQCLYPELSRHMKSNLACAVAFTNAVLETSTKEIPQAIKDTLLQNVAQDMSTVSIDMRDHEYINGQLAAFEQRKTTSADATPLAKLTSPALGLFVKHMYGLRLYKSVELMLIRLRSEMNHALILDLHEIYVPFLQDLIGLMLIYGIPMREAAYSSFFEDVLQNYFLGFVGQEARSEVMGHTPWTLRADAALDKLESFDHSYFQDILGDRYDTVVLSSLLRLQSRPQNYGILGSITTSRSETRQNRKPNATTGRDAIDAAIATSTSRFTS